METQSPLEVLIIGSGIGGLSAGIILARLGYRVVIIEGNSLPGGLMRGYRREGWTVPSGSITSAPSGRGNPSGGSAITWA